MDDLFNYLLATDQLDEFLGLKEERLEEEEETEEVDETEE